MSEFLQAFFMRRCPSRVAVVSGGGRSANGQQLVLLASALLTFALLAAGRPIGCEAAERVRTGRPNVLLVLTDDQSYETLGVTGRCQAETPHLNQLASQGTVFRYAYNMGSWSGAVCLASRAMLNTGRFLWRAHEVDRQLQSEQAAGRTWPEIMRRAGYRTYMTGKWHVPLDPHQAFDVVRHVRGGMPGATPQMYNRPRTDQPDVWTPWDPKFGGFWEGGTHWSEVVANDALAFLDEAKSREEPFFLYVAFNAPHDPRQSPREFVERYPAEEISLPVNFLPTYPFHKQIGCGPGLRDEQLGPFPRTEHAVRVHRSEYYALVSHTDQQIGRILQSLADSGLEDNTYVIFTSDHGLAVGHHGLFGKQNMYDHSVRVPLIVRGPDVPKGKTVDAPVYLQDVAPTAIEIAGVNVPEHVEFHSLMPALRGEEHRPYEAIYGAYLNLQRMVTSEGYKLIVYPEAGKLRLYNIERDPEEQHDLAEAPAHASIVKQLFDRLLTLQTQMDDPLTLSPGDYFSDAGTSR